MVKLYCPKCMDVYTPKSSRHHHTDGAYFGTGFPHMLFMVHPEYRPKRPNNQFVPRYCELGYEWPRKIFHGQHFQQWNLNKPQGLSLGPTSPDFSKFFFFLEEGRWRRGRGCKTKMLLSLINNDIPEDTTPGDKTWQHPQINLSIFQSISVIQLLLSSVLPCGCKERSFSCNLSNMKHQTLQATRREWKSNAQQSVFGKLWDLWKCDATLSPMLDISSQVKIESPLQIIYCCENWYREFEQKCSLPAYKLYWVT